MNPVPFFTRLHIALQRLVRWEFWPWRVVYLPVAVYWFYLAIRARGWVYFSAANPCMRFGGLITYSKWDILKPVPQELRPRTIIIDIETEIDHVFDEIEMQKMVFPLIIKPDMGERGKGVEILQNEAELRNALQTVSETMMLQTFEKLPVELGILYSRHPDEEMGTISSVVVKEFPTPTGDGKRSLLQLILSNQRTRLNYKAIIERLQNRWNEVPADGEVVEVVKLGNHMLGTTFIDGNHLINNKLLEVFDTLAKKLDGFFIGRFGVRTSSIEELEKGNFKVIEVNGAGSEPAHIYDPNMPLWKGLHALFAQWKRMYEISVANHKNGAPYGSFREIRAEIKRHHVQ
ncbi:MAG: ATP-grasp domain-containing protein [Flavobacteriales bacterium]|nr:ATP-grasp domain-containing protein [Flavobacteriales bacterium]